jgi:hypothetical protein
MDPISLVIDAPALERMRVDEGSLAIKARGRSEQRVPLGRLLRIDITGTPACAMDCLLELAARSVPVTFFRSNGSVRAQLFNPRPSPTDLSHWLGELFTASGESPTYRAWRENHLRAIFRTNGLHGGVVSQLDREHRELLQHELRRRGLESMHAALAEIQAGLVEARVGEMLLRFGVAPGGAAQCQLAADLCGLCNRWLLGRSLEWLTKLQAGEDQTVYERYLRSLCSMALDEWLYRLLSRLCEAATGFGLHRDVA